MAETGPSAPRIIVFSALCRESGSQLRARYLAKALGEAGARVRLVRGFCRLPLGLDYLVSLLTNARLAFASCDVIIGLKPLPNVTLPLLVQKLRGRLTVLDIDDVDFGYRQGWIARLNRALQRPFPARFDLVCYHADRLRDFIVRTFAVSEDRLFQLPQGIDTSLFTAGACNAETRAERARLGLDGRALVAYTAHLNIASDLDAIFDIVALARRTLPNLCLLVIGGGPLEAGFRRLARVRGVEAMTRFTGHLPPEQVVRKLRLADAGLVYYKDNEVNLYRESMKLREMLALGMPIVCNDVGDLRRFCEYTYQTGSEPGAVAAELVRLLGEGPDGRECRGSAFVHETMDWKAGGLELLERLRHMLGSAAR